MSEDFIIASVVGLLILLALACYLSRNKQKLIKVEFRGWNAEGVPPTQWTRLEVNAGPYYFKPDDEIYVGVTGKRVRVARRGQMSPPQSMHFKLPRIDTLPRGTQHITAHDRAGNLYYLHFEISKGAVPCVT